MLRRWELLLCSCPRPITTIARDRTWPCSSSPTPQFTQPYACPNPPTISPLELLAGPLAGTRTPAMVSTVLAGSLERHFVCPGSHRISSSLRYPPAPIVSDLDSTLSPLPVSRTLRNLRLRLISRPTCNCLYNRLHQRLLANPARPGMLCGGAQPGVQGPCQV